MSEVSASQAARLRGVTAAAVVYWIKHATHPLSADGILETGERVPAADAIASGAKVLQWRIKETDVLSYVPPGKDSWDLLTREQKAQAVELLKASRVKAA